MTDAGDDSDISPAIRKDRPENRLQPLHLFRNGFLMEEDGCPHTVRSKNPRTQLSAV